MGVCILLTAGAVEQAGFILLVVNQSDKVLVISDTTLLDTLSANTATFVYEAIHVEPF